MVALTMNARGKLKPRSETGACEALAMLFDDEAIEMGDGCTCAQCSADYALARLWKAGFKLVPVTA